MEAFAPLPFSSGCQQHLPNSTALQSLVPLRLIFQEPVLFGEGGPPEPSCTGAWWEPVRGERKGTMGGNQNVSKMESNGSGR